MRLAILDSGHSFGTKVLFAFMRAVSRLPVPDAIKLNRYRPDFYGTPMRVAHPGGDARALCMVGWRPRADGRVRVADQQCEVCTKTHAAVAALAYQDEAKVSAALADLETAPIEEPLRATLRMLRKLTREHAVDADDMRAVLAAGVSREQIEDALAVCFTFNTVDRLSRTFGWFVRVPKPSRPARSSCSRAATVDEHVKPLIIGAGICGPVTAMTPQRPRWWQQCLRQTQRLAVFQATDSAVERTVAVVIHR